VSITYHSKDNYCGTMPTMGIEYATVKAKGQVVIPVDIRRKFQIDEGTRVAFLEEEGRLFIQPVTDEFIEGMKGILAGRGLPARIERNPDRKLR
jgi:AbrB family looped-hinge helix DNA binding protein